MCALAPLDPLCCALDKLCFNPFIFLMYIPFSCSKLELPITLIPVFLFYDEGAFYYFNELNKFIYIFPPPLCVCVYVCARARLCKV